MIAWLLALIVGLGVIGYLWWIGHPWIIDRGEGKRGWHDGHSKYHAGGAAAVGFVVALFDGPVSGFVVSSILWTAVEIAQWLPRHDIEDGYFEWWDIAWNEVGAFAGGWLGGLLSVRALEAQTLTIDSTRTGSGNAPLFMIGLGVVVLIAVVVLVALNHEKSDGPEAGDVRDRPYE